MKHDTFDYDKFKPVLLDSTGRKLTVGLFHELADPDATVKPVFYLSDWRKIYVDIADPTGYRAADALIGNWEHWLALCANQRFKAELDSWNEEVAVKLASEAISALVKQSKGPQGTTAAKWLAEKGYAPKTKGNKKEVPEEPAGHDWRKDAKRLKIV
jgi:hypothetical protein